MSDLIKRLRRWNIIDDGTLDGGSVMRDMRDAAHEIEILNLKVETYKRYRAENRRLQARIEKLDKLLRDVLHERVDRILEEAKSNEHT